MIIIKYYELPKKVDIIVNLNIKQKIIKIGKRNIIWFKPPHNNKAKIGKILKLIYYFCVSVYRLSKNNQQK